MIPGLCLPLWGNCSRLLQTPDIPPSLLPHTGHSPPLMSSLPCPELPFPSVSHCFTLLFQGASPRTLLLFYCSVLTYGSIYRPDSSFAPGSEFSFFYLGLPSTDYISSLWNRKGEEGEEGIIYILQLKSQPNKWSTFVITLTNVHLVSASWIPPTTRNSWPLIEAALHFQIVLSELLPTGLRLAFWTQSRSNFPSHVWRHLSRAPSSVRTPTSRSWMRGKLKARPYILEPDFRSVGLD